MNLERSLRLGDRLGGHIVLGHVDGVGRLDAITPEGDGCCIASAPRSRSGPISWRRARSPSTASASPSFAARTAASRAALIPHTLQQTTLAELVPGDRVNLEADVLLKHIEACSSPAGARADVACLPSSRPDISAPRARHGGRPISVGDQVVNLQVPGVFRVVARRGAFLEIETAQGLRMTVTESAVRKLVDERAAVAPAMPERLLLGVVEDDAERAALAGCARRCTPWRTVTR